MKRIIAALLVISTLFCTGCSKSSDKFSDQRTSGVRDASGDLYREFDSGGRIVFPDYYAGRYFSEDGKKLFVCVTSEYSSELDFLLEKYDCVEFNVVELSRNELDSLSEQYETELADNFPELNFFQTEIDEKGNRVIIELDPQDLENNIVMQKLEDHFNGKPVIFGEPPTGYWA